MENDPPPVENDPPPAKLARPLQWKLRVDPTDGK